MGGVGALGAARVDPSLLVAHRKDRLEEPCFRASGKESSAKLAEDRVIEPCVSQLQAQQIVPFNPSAHRFCGLAVGEAFNILQHAHEGEAPRGFCWTTTESEEVCELLISKDRSQHVPHPQTQTSFRERGMG
jgi:hypothetical protein